MIHLSRLVDPEAVRAINLEFLARRADYVVVDAELDNRQSIEAEIWNVNPRRIEDVLQSVPPFREEHAELAWAHYMAAAVGVQLWPDANHRTALLTFDATMQFAMGESISINENDASALLAGSKAILHQNRVPPGQPVFSLAETANPDHPLRQHFLPFAERLVWTRIDR